MSRQGVRRAGSAAPAIDRPFVDHWAAVFDERTPPDTEAGPGGLDVRCRFQAHPQPRHLHKDWFVAIACWKSPRGKGRYLSNDEGRVEEVTGRAFACDDDLERLRTLRSLEGVGARVASAVLHFLDEERYPIFDYHCCSALRRAALWHRSQHDFGDLAWLEFTQIARRLSERLGVSLRTLDRALWACDKWG